MPIIDWLLQAAEALPSHMYMNNLEYKIRSHLDPLVLK